jgi:hypothetical protein
VGVLAWPVSGVVPWDIREAVKRSAGAYGDGWPVIGRMERLIDSDRSPLRTTQQRSQAQANTALTLGQGAR